MNIPKTAALALVAASLSLASAPAHAQEAVDWSGFYAGIFGGYGSGKMNYEIVDPLGLAGLTGDSNIGGLFGGAALGVNYQFEQGFVLGAEADIALSDIAATGTLTLVGAPPGIGLGIVSEVTNSASLRARVGYAVDRFLPFATAGLALGRAKNSLSFPGVGAVDLSNETRFGWTIGAGVEYAATDNISIKAEYRYSNFGSDSKASTLFPLPGATENSKLWTQDIRLGVNYRF